MWQPNPSLDVSRFFFPEGFSAEVKTRAEILWVPISQFDIQNISMHCMYKTKFQVESAVKSK